MESWFKMVYGFNEPGHRSILIFYEEGVVGSSIIVSVNVA